MMRLDSIASMIDSPQSAPGTTSRGAIQQVTESASSRATIASATALSFIECLRKHHEPCCGLCFVYCCFAVYDDVRGNVNSRQNRPIDLARPNRNAHHQG